MENNFNSFNTIGEFDSSNNLGSNVGENLNHLEYNILNDARIEKCLAKAFRNDFINRSERNNICKYLFKEALESYFSDKNINLSESDMKIPTNPTSQTNPENIKNPKNTTNTTNIKNSENDSNCDNSISLLGKSANLPACSALKRAPST